MRYFDFSRLINKYRSQFSAIIFLEGYYDDKGDWVKGTNEEITVYGAVISHRESKVFRSEGRLTEKDKRLFTLEPISNELQGSQVVYEGNVYSIMDNVENAKFTGVYAYTLKYVSAFKEKRVDVDITETVEALEERLDGVRAASEPPVPPADNVSEDKEKLENRLDGVLND